jgi:hypothetical protein
MVGDEGVAVHIGDHAFQRGRVYFHQLIVVGKECFDDRIGEVVGKILARDAEIEQTDRLIIALRALTEDTYEDLA